LGALTALDVDDINLNGKTITITGDTDDTFSIVTGAAGATTLTTIDDNAAAGHFEIAADGNITLDAAGNIALETAGGSFSCDAAAVDFTGTSANRPSVNLTNNANDATGPNLFFRNMRDGNGLEDSDVLGKISFAGEDAGGATQNSYGSITGSVIEADHGDEAGQIAITVANDGTERNGITMTADKGTATEVDVTIANGAASTTTIAGTLTMGSTATLNNTGQIQVASQPSITTLAGLTSLGAAGATTDIAAGDVTMYNAVNDGAPTISIGSSATERLEITALYASGTQQVNQAVFKTYTASGTSNRGRFAFSVDETTTLQIWDAGLNLSANMALQINGTSIIADSSGTATLSNIDALDATTEATIEAAMDTLPNVTSLGTLTGLTTSGAIELGHASDTTIARSAAGVVTIESKPIQTTNVHHHFIHAGWFFSYPYSRYIPLNGSIVEQNTATGSPEYVNFTWPYDGFVKTMWLRSETDMGSTNLKLYKGATGATVSTALGNVTATVGASAAVEFDFTSVTNTYSQGDTMAILCDPTEDPDGGQNITIELVFDLTT
jgi:hypothetical protein